MIGLARVRLAQEDREEAESILEQLEARGFLEPEAEKLKAALHIAGGETIDLGPLREAVESAPDDNEAVLALAEALAKAGEHEESLQRCLELVARDRQGTGETARKLMLDVFRVLPDDSELNSEYRRKLSMTLY